MTHLTEAVRRMRELQRDDEERRRNNGDYMAEFTIKAREDAEAEVDRLLLAEPATPPAPVRIDPAPVYALLRRSLAQLGKWQRKYGEHNPQWLPPDGDVKLAEDIDAMLNQVPAAPQAEPSDEKLAMIVRDGYDKYWRETSRGTDAGAWAAAARAVLALRPTPVAEPAASGASDDKLIRLLSQSCGNANCPRSEPQSAEKLGDSARYRCRRCGEQNAIEFNSARIVTHNQFTGKPRDQRDIDSDPEGKLIIDPDMPLRPAPVAEPAASGAGRVLYADEPISEQSHTPTPAASSAGDAAGSNLQLARRLRRFRSEHYTHWSVEENELVIECFHALAAAAPPQPVPVAPQRTCGHLWTSDNKGYPLQCKECGLSPEATFVIHDALEELREDGLEKAFPILAALWKIAATPAIAPQPVAGCGCTPFERQHCRPQADVAVHPACVRAARSQPVAQGDDFSDADDGILQSAYDEFESFHKRRHKNPDARAIKRPLTEGSLIDGMACLFDVFDQYEDFWLHWKESPGVVQHVRAMIDTDRAARSKREGWQWVPIEPTPEMIAAGNKKTWVFPSRDCWVSMLSAAPTTSGGEQP